MSKLWAIKLEVEVVVCAETEDEARKIAESDWQDGGSELEAGFSYELTAKTLLPLGWDETCLPLGLGDDEYTIGAIRAANEAAGE